MSGRDMRHFVTNHRAADSGVLVQRMKDGLHSSKYKQVDYEKLRALTSEKKFAGQEKLVKVKKLQQISKQGKEQNLLKQHHMVWKKEHRRLISVQNSLQADIDSHIHQNSDSELLGEAYDDLENFAAKLERDLDKFQAATTTPVLDLRDDLKYWIQAQNSRIQNAYVESDPDEVRVTVDRVKSQQEGILERLEQEQHALEQKLSIGELPTMSALPPLKKVQTGIPEEAFNLECPDLDLKASVLQQFIFIDQKYVEKLEEMETEHSSAIQSSTGDWSEEDHFVFLYVLDQYTHDVPNRRTLYIDRMRRHMPHKSRSQIVAHEEWWILYKYFHERRKDLILDWLRDRAEMMNRAKVTFEELVTHEREDALRHEKRSQQREICDQLYQKVRQWREEKLEAMRLQQEQQEERRRESMEQLRAQEEREKLRREKEKEQLKVYHDDQRAERLRLEEERRERLETLKRRLAEQAEYDKQRVKYREAETEKKEADRKKVQEERAAAEEEKQRVLERIRQQVRPNVEGDLLRLWSETEAWQARVRRDDEFINIQKPLYELNTFTAKKVAADPRFRLAEKLHEAGLTGNTYAREVLSQVQPAQPARKDMTSTVFNHL